MTGSESWVFGAESAEALARATVESADVDAESVPTLALLQAAAARHTRTTMVSRRREAPENITGERMIVKCNALRGRQQVRKLAVRLCTTIMHAAAERNGTGMPQVIPFRRKPFDTAGRS